MFLRHSQNLASDSVSDDCLKALWLGRISRARRRGHESGTAIPGGPCVFQRGIVKLNRSPSNRSAGHPITTPRTFGIDRIPAVLQDRRVRHPRDSRFRALIETIECAGTTVHSVAPRKSAATPALVRQKTRKAGVACARRFLTFDKPLVRDGPHAEDQIRNRHRFRRVRVSEVVSARERTTYELYATNGSTIPTYGCVPVRHDLRLRRDLCWKIVIAMTR